MTDTLIKVEGVSKKFCLSLKKSLWYGVQDLGNEIRARRHGGDGELRPQEFWAVKDIDLELKRGETLGLIGRNGAGKTTLLRMLNGLIKPDAGRVTMKGRIGALIALGSGFSPILTGRENIYVNASVLGLTKAETNEKLEEIVEFAEIGEFLDMPVQNYSSGMQVRLGFAVASVLSPDILLIDEVLAVGDIRFRMKCYAKIDEIREQSAVIFVSHSIEQIGRICTSTLVMSHGQNIFNGETSAGLEVYYDSIKESTNEFMTRAPEHSEQEFVRSVSVNRKEGTVKSNTSLNILLLLDIKQVFSANIRLTIVDLRTNSVVGTAETLIEQPIGILLDLGQNKIDLTISSLPLRSGPYDVRITIFNANTGRIVYTSSRKCDIDVKAEWFGESSIQFPLEAKRVN